MKLFEMKLHTFKKTFIIQVPNKMGKKNPMEKKTDKQK